MTKKKRDPVQVAFHGYHLAARFGGCTVADLMAVAGVTRPTATDALNHLTQTDLRDLGCVVRIPGATRTSAVRFMVKEKDDD